MIIEWKPEHRQVPFYLTTPCPNSQTIGLAVRNMPCEHPVYWIIFFIKHAGELHAIASRRRIEFVLQVVLTVYIHAFYIIVTTVTDYAKLQLNLAPANP